MIINDDGHICAVNYPSTEKYEDKDRYCDTCNRLLYKKPPTHWEKHKDTYIDALAVILFTATMLVSAFFAIEADTIPEVVTWLVIFNATVLFAFEFVTDRKMNDLRHENFKVRHKILDLEYEIEKLKVKD